MRTVVSNQQVAALWAAQSQDYAQNAKKSIYFKGPTIYSYGNHFPMAIFVSNRKGEKAVLRTTKTSSVTTADHMSEVYRVLPASMPCFYVPLFDGCEHSYSGADYLRPYFKDWREDYPQRISEAFVKAEHSRAKRNKLYYYNKAQELQHEANQFIQFWELGGIMDRLPDDMPKRLALAQLKDILGGN